MFFMDSVTKMDLEKRTREWKEVSEFILSVNEDSMYSISKITNNIEIMGVKGIWKDECTVTLNIEEEKLSFICGLVDYDIYVDMGLDVDKEHWESYEQKLRDKAELNGIQITKEGTGDEDYDLYSLTVSFFEFWPDNIHQIATVWDNFNKMMRTKYNIK